MAYYTLLQYFCWSDEDICHNPSRASSSWSARSAVITATSLHVSAVCFSFNPCADSQLETATVTVHSDCFDRTYRTSSLFVELQCTSNNVSLFHVVEMDFRADLVVGDVADRLTFCQRDVSDWRVDPLQQVVVQLQPSKSIKSVRWESVTCNQTEEMIHLFRLFGSFLQFGCR